MYDWRRCLQHMVGVAQLVEHLVVVQVVAGSSPVTHPKKIPARVVACGDRCVLGHNGQVLSGNRKFQRVVVGLVVGLVVVSLALTLVGGAFAATPDLVGDGQTSPSVPGLVGTTEPKPVTETPQGTSTQVSDSEHLGGLIAFIAFMLGGVLLLIRGRRRERREQAAAKGPGSILSHP